jgi:hypothetical protein
MDCDIVLVNHTFLSHCSVTSPTYAVLSSSAPRSPQLRLSLLRFTLCGARISISRSKPWTVAWLRRFMRNHDNAIKNESLAGQAIVRMKGWRNNPPSIPMVHLSNSKRDTRRVAPHRINVQYPSTWIWSKDMTGKAIVNVLYTVADYTIAYRYRGIALGRISLGSASLLLRCERALYEKIPLG